MARVMERVRSMAASRRERWSRTGSLGMLVPAGPVDRGLLTLTMLWVDPDGSVTPRLNFSEEIPAQRVGIGNGPVADPLVALAWFTYLGARWKYQGGRGGMATVRWHPGHLTSDSGS